MTEMVYGSVPVSKGEPIIPKWWRTVDKWTLMSVMLLFSIGILLGLAASPPLAEKNGFAPFHYVQRQAVFGGHGPDCDVCHIHDVAYFGAPFGGDWVYRGLYRGRPVACLWY